MPTGGGGSFKVIYQDANHELVLVPEADTFQADTQYAIAVKKGLGDAQGNPLSPDILTNILTSPDPIVVDGKIFNTLVRDLVGDESDGGIASATVFDDLRAGYSLIIQGLQQLVRLTHVVGSVVHIYHRVGKSVVAAGTASLLSAVQKQIHHQQANMYWATSYPSTASTLRPTVDLKTAVLASRPV